MSTQVEEQVGPLKLDADKVAEAIRKEAPQKPEDQIKSVIEWPAFLSRANDEYTSGKAHTFVLYGNVNDYQDNHGHSATLRMLMTMAYDDNYVAEVNKKRGLQVAESAKKTKEEKPHRIAASFIITEGMKFESEESQKVFREIMNTEYKELIASGQVPKDFLNPQTFEGTMLTLKYWFQATKKIVKENALAKIKQTSLRTDAQLTMMFYDCDAFFPSGNISSLNSDRKPIVMMRNWAIDTEIGTRNRIFLVTRHLTQIHESLRGGFSGISAINVPNPTFEDLQEFSKNYTDRFERLCQIAKNAGQEKRINGKEVTRIEFAEGFTHRDVAIHGSGLSRKQVEMAFRDAQHREIAIDDHQIRVVKQRCMEEEYDGILEFVHPNHGFDQVGGHQELKDYIRECISIPLRNQDVRTCSPGVLMLGPPGTGKTFIALATAAEAGVNFVELKLGMLLNKYVGGTEERTERLFEAIRAAAPCITFIDEIEQALGGGRVTEGDSNTGGRLFSSVMKFLSDESRLGKIVVMAASNRPDMLDSALIRAGRFGAILPVLPPPKSGTEAVYGRLNILNSLSSKHKITFSKDLAATSEDRNKGLGRLIWNESQIWTGAEIELVMKDAIGLAIRAKERPKTVITLEDWEIAMDSVLPRTGDVDRMTNLALYFSNNVRYCPPVWREKMRNQAELIESLRLNVA